MKCWTKQEMEVALLDKDQSLLQSHIAHCQACRSLYAACLAEQEEWNQSLFPDVLPDAWDEKVMSALGNITIEGETVQEDSTRILHSGKRNRVLRRTGIAAAIFILLCGVLVYAQPTIAELVRSLFNADGSADIGLLEARKLGIVQDPKVKVTDQGYTLEINEVVADGTRIVIAVKLTDREGRVVRGLDSGALDWRGLKITDDTGQEIAELKSLGGAKYFDKLTFIITKPMASNTIHVSGDFKELMLNLNKPRIQGHWKFDFTVDMTRANELTKVEPLGAQYTTPEGLHIQMNRLVRTPSGVSLEITTSLSKDAIVRSSLDMQQQLLLMYHFEDEQGTTISLVNSQNGGLDSLIAQYHTLDEQTGETHWVYTFMYLPFDKQQVRFVLDGYSLPLERQASVNFHPTMLGAKPVVFEDAGDTIQLLGMKIDKNPNEQDGELVGLINFAGQARNMFYQEEWVVQDGQGRQYPVQFRGGIEGGEMKKIDGDFIVEGMMELPEQLTLMRKVVNQRFTDVNWSFPLPLGEPFPELDRIDLQKLWQ